jgi:hypothetical protein
MSQNRAAVQGDAVAEADHGILGGNKNSVMAKVK